LRLVEPQSTCKAALKGTGKISMLGALNISEKQALSNELTKA